MKKDTPIAVRLEQQDWKAVLLCLTRHADCVSPPGNPTAFCVGRDRLRFIAEKIRAALP